MSWDKVRSVTLLCDRFWPDAHGGLERKMWNLARTLAGLGHRVHVVTENRVGAPERETILPNLVVQRVGPIHYGPLWRCVSMVRLVWWYRRVRTRPVGSTIWASEPRAALAVILAGRRRDLVYQPIGCQAAMHALSRVHRQVQTMRTSGMLRLLDRLAYRLAPQIIFESQNVRDQFRQCYGDRRDVHVVHNGVELPPNRQADRVEARRRWGLGKDDWVVGFVGRLDPCKDLPFLFQAIAGRSDDRDSRLLLVGQGPDRTRLERLARTLGLADRIIWAGRVDEPHRLYAAMDVMVLPSVYEAFGNVLQEAMAAGVPVVGRRRDADPSRPVLTANQELIQPGETGLWVDPHDPADLGRQLSILRQFPAAREAISRRCRAWAARRPWPQVVHQYLQCVGQAASTPSAKVA